MKRGEKCRAVRAALSAPLCLIAALLSACQPTPTEEVVVQRVELNVLGQEEQPAPAGPVLADLLPLPERVDRPERTLGIGGVAFVAEVAAPEAEVCPVVEVRQAPFTTERLRALAEAFCPGATLYHSWEQTRQELLELRTALLESGIDSEDVRIKLKWLDESIPTAPLTVEQVPFSWNEVPASGYLGIRAQREGGNFSTLHLGPHLFAYFRDGDHALLPKSAFTEREFSRFPAPEVTQEAAEAAAMEALALASVSPERVRMTGVEQYVDQRGGMPVCTGYLVSFAEVYAGLPGIHANGVSLVKPDVPPSTGAPWGAEMICFYMDGKGVAQFLWQDPCAFGAVLEQDAALLPFEQAVERTEQLLLYQHAQIPGLEADGTDGVLQHVEVYRISLVRGCIQLRDERDVGQSVPLWRFDYVYRYTDNAPQEMALYLDARTGAYVEPRMDMETLMQLTS